METVSHKPFQSSYAKVAELKKTLRVEQFAKERALAGGLIHLSSLVHVTRQMQSVGDKTYESIPDTNTNVVAYRYGKTQENQAPDARAATPLADHFSRAPPRILTMTEPSSVHILRNLTTVMKSDCIDRRIHI